MTQLIYSQSPLATWVSLQASVAMYAIITHQRIKFARRAGEGTRTPNLLITNQLLYRLSYASSLKEQLLFWQ